MTRVSAVSSRSKVDVLQSDSVDGDDEGRFTLGDLVPGEWEIHIDSPSTVSEFSTTVGVNEGEVTRRDFTVRPGSYVYGSVRDAETGRPVRMLYWTEDSRFILYPQDTNGDENFHLFRADVETGETVELTPFPGARAMLVTASLHMPRAVAEFRARGLRVIPAPVTTYSPREGVLSKWVPGTAGLRDSRNLIYETLANIVRRLRVGRR